jgi:predicted RNase H-like HicB family nuclease
LHRRGPSDYLRGVALTFTIELDREDDGRWIAEIPALPGVLVYGATEPEALARVEALALRVVADRVENGETAAESLSVSFVRAAA